MKHRIFPMINYRPAGYEGDVFRMAAQDAENWNAAERRVLQKIAEEEDVSSENIGTGRTYWVKGERMQFHLHKAAEGWNISRAK